MAAIKDVARYAGFSVSAVSKYLKDPDSVRPDTRKKIEEAIRVLNYRPSMIARALRTKNTNTLLLVTDEILTVPSNEVIYSIQREAEKRGYAILIMTQDNIRRITHAQTSSLAMSAATVDGIIYTWVTDKQLIREHANLMSSTPKVSVSRAAFIPGVPNASRDEEDAIYQATKHLIGLGHDRIAMISNVEDDELFNNRRYGFLRAMSEAGKRVYDDLRINNTLKYRNVYIGYEGMREIMDRSVRPTAIVTDNDFIAIGCCQYCHEHGIRIPEDLAVTGSLNTPPAEIAYPPVTTTSFPSPQIAEWVLETLMTMIRSGGSTEGIPENTCFPSELIVRRSTDITKPSFIVPEARQII